MRIAVTDGGRNLNEVNYINAHGTSTPLNDVMETRAVKSLFGDHSANLCMSSFNGNASVMGKLSAGVTLVILYASTGLRTR